jgi:hypothetical protein
MFVPGFETFEMLVAYFIVCVEFAHLEHVQAPYVH